jgi:3-oxoacyl-[acyl-carrier protein] reductase
VIDLTGTRLLVTGGSRGIGRATALMAARAGADVGVCYHTRRDEAEQVARQIRGEGRRAYSGGGDLGDAATVDRVMREVAAAFGGLDAVVVNHGVWPAGDVPLVAMQPERWRATLATNLDSVLLVTRAALNLIGTGGRVVVVSSTAGQRGEAGHADYAASKGAIISLVKSLAIECAPRVTVNAVAPGWVDTAMSASAYEGGRRDAVAASIPLGRIATAEDVAGPILFLLSNLARHVTGEVINVNGGSVLCG